MPHVIVKMHKGRTDLQKQQLAAAITKDLVEIAGSPTTSVSVSIEEFDPADWPEAVYRPDILNGAGTLVQPPGYNPFET